MVMILKTQNKIKIFRMISLYFIAKIQYFQSLITFFLKINSLKIKKTNLAKISLVS